MLTKEAEKQCHEIETSPNYYEDLSFLPTCDKFIELIRKDNREKNISAKRVLGITRAQDLRKDIVAQLPDVNLDSLYAVTLFNYIDDRLKWFAHPPQYYSITYGLISIADDGTSQIWRVYKGQVEKTSQKLSDYLENKPSLNDLLLLENSSLAPTQDKNTLQNEKKYI